MASKILSLGRAIAYVQQVTAFRLILSIKLISSLTFYFHTHLFRLLRHIQKWTNVFLFAKVMFKEFLDPIIPPPPPPSPGIIVPPHLPCLFKTCRQDSFTLSRSEHKVEGDVCRMSSGSLPLFPQCPGLFTTCHYSESTQGSLPEPSHSTRLIKYTTYIQHCFIKTSIGSSGVKGLK